MIFSYKEYRWQKVVRFKFRQCERESESRSVWIGRNRSIREYSVNGTGLVLDRSKSSSISIGLGVNTAQVTIFFPFCFVLNFVFSLWYC